MQHKSNPANHVMLSNHVVTGSFPARLDLLTQAPNVRGLGRSTWSGVCGTESAQRALHLAQRSADARGLQCFTVRTWVTLRGLEENKGRMTRDQVLHTGLLHLDRIRAEFRDELHDYVLSRLASSLHGEKMARLRELKFEELMALYPAAAELLLDAQPTVTLVVHPAHLVSGDGRPVWIGSIRRQDLQQYRSETRYLEDSCPVS
jgi:hypothetical protein